MPTLQSTSPSTSLQEEIASYITLAKAAIRFNERLPPKAAGRTLLVPQTFPTISSAIRAAKPGDTVLVSAGEYHEAVSVPASKSSIRFVAKGNVVLDGRRILSSAFTLRGNHIEINGFTIRNYLRSGIQVNGVFGCRLVSNTIERITLGNGIRMIVGSFSNLIWKNRIAFSRMDGIDMRGKNNYIVANHFSKNRGRGIHLRALGNYVVNNHVYENGADGITDRTGLNLHYKNKIYRNGSNGLHETSGFGGAAIPSNLFRQNKRNGIQLDTRDSIVLKNLIDQNAHSGILVRGNRHVLQSNLITLNRNNGGIISGRDNLLLRNHIKDNVPFDIVTLPSRNTLIENVCKTSMPAEICDNKRKALHKVLHVPRQYKTISAAVAAAAPGSTILVQDGTYSESITIPLSKSSIRLIADGKQVILHGRGSRSTGITVRANNVEIKGFHITGYQKAGLLVGGIGNKLIANSIKQISAGDGITLSRAFSTLLWQNRITQARRHGISILAMNTWCIGNQILHNGGHGVLTTEVTTVGNIIADNMIANNAKDGIADSAGFNLILRNSLIGNLGDGVHERSGAGYASILENTIQKNNRFGLELANNGNFTAKNVLSANRLGNIRVTGEFNVFERNRVASTSARTNRRPGKTVVYRSVGL